MKELIQEMLYDIARERDIEHQALLIRDCAKKLTKKAEPETIKFPLPKNVFISSGIVPTAYYEIAMPQHMVKVRFLNNKGEIIDNSYKTFPLGDRFLIEVDGIPSLLIKKVNFAPLNWDNNTPSKTILYVWEPGHKSLFNIDTWYSAHPFAQWTRHTLN